MGRVDDREEVLLLVASTQYARTGQTHPMPSISEYVESIGPASGGTFWLKVEDGVNY